MCNRSYTKRVMRPTEFHFTGVILKERSGYSALCLEVDVASEGRTREEARANLLEAVELYVETAIESNLPVLRPVPSEANPLKRQSKKVVETFPFTVDLRVRARA